MSMLSAQADRLRLTADVISERGVSGGDLAIIEIRLREAADTIESLRDGLLKAERVCDEKSYDAGFDNGVKACLQQLDGLIVSGYDLKAVCVWIDNQLEEES